MNWLCAITMGVLLTIHAWFAADFDARHRFNQHIAAARTRGEPVLIEDFNVPAIPDNQNSAVLLQQAAKAIATTASFYEKPYENLWEPPYSPADVNLLRGVVQDSTTARRLVRQADGLLKAEWPVKLGGFSAKDFDAIIEPQQSLAINLMFAWDYFHAVRNDAEAVAILLDLVHQTNAVEQMNYFQLSQLTAASFYDIATYQIVCGGAGIRIANAPTDSVAGAASKTQVRNLIADFLAAMPNSDAANALRQNRARLVEAYENPKLLTSMRNGPAWIAQLLQPAFISVMARGFDAYTREANAMSQPDLSKVLAIFPKPASPSDVSIVEMTGQMGELSLFCPNTSDAYPRGFFREQTYCRLAALALAARLYESDHGSFPRNLQQLVPDYLPSVPADPFSPTDAAMRYRHTSTERYIYSLCPYPAEYSGPRTKPFLSVSLRPKPFTIPALATKPSQRR